MKKITSPIFVIGTPRSGTTLTAKILGKHSRLFMPGETHYFDDIYYRRNQIGSLNIDETFEKIAERLYTLYGRYNEPDDQDFIQNLFPDIGSLSSHIKGSKSYCEILERFMDVQKEHKGKNRWGNNAPKDIFNIKEILDCFPNAKFIVCVRDLRAFLYSYKGKWKNTVSDFHTQRVKKLYHPVITSYLWKASMKQLSEVKRYIPENNYVIVRYEDLVSEPETTVKNICETIGEQFEPEMLEIETHNSSNVSRSKGIFTSSINLWETELTPEEIAVGQYIAGEQLIECSYKPVSVKIKPIRLFLIYLTTPFALIRALNANKKSIGPIIPYLIKRIKDRKSVV